MSNEYKETWFVIPRRILELPNMTFGYLKIYESIFQFWNKNLNCYLSTEALCERTNLNERQVYKALAYFESHGELQRVQKGFKRYILQPKANSSIITQDCTPVHEPLHSSAVNPCTPVHHNIKNRNKEIKDIKKESNKNLNKGRTSPVKQRKEPVKNLSMQLSDVLGCNPFEISQSMLSDWLDIRKSKRAIITATAWDKLNRELQKCVDNGVSPHEAFETMVANGWVSLKSDWLKTNNKTVATKSQPVYDDTNTDWIKDIEKDMF